MAGIQKWSTILLSAILLFTAVCFTAEADGSAGTPYEAGGNGSAAAFFYVESAGTNDFQALQKKVAETVKSKIGFTPLVYVVELGFLPRSEKKSKRVIDERFQ